MKKYLGLILTFGIALGMEKKKSPIRQAMEIDDKDRVLELIINGDDSDLRYHNLPLLHESAYSEWEDILYLMLEHEDPDKEDEKGRIPFYYAAFWGRLNAVKMLLKVNVHLNKESHCEFEQRFVSKKKPRLNEIISRLNSVHLNDVDWIKRFDDIKNTMIILAPYKKILDELEPMKTERKKEKKYRRRRKHKKEKNRQ